MKDTLELKTGGKILNTVISIGRTKNEYTYFLKKRNIIYRIKVVLDKSTHNLEKFSYMIESTSQGFLPTLVGLSFNNLQDLVDHINTRRIKLK